MGLLNEAFRQMFGTDFVPKKKKKKTSNQTSHYHFHTTNIQLPPKPPQRKIQVRMECWKHIPTDQEILAVKEGLNEQETLLIDFCHQTGCRINEALRLRGADIGEAYIVLYTRKSKNSNLTPRKIPKPACLADYKPGKGRVFPEWSDVPRFLEKRVRKLKIPYWSWHNLRHKYASELSKRGVPLFEIMNLLGHSNMKTTQNYLQLLGF